MSVDVYGAIIAIAGPVNERQEAEVLALLGEMARNATESERIVLREPIQILRHANVTEDDWRLMGPRWIDWQPGAEIWGWKCEGDRITQEEQGT